ncbi:MAG: hypothetical protein KatS3mg012_0420 [Gaiellaceae bacterium]|nr:MAG: hypothetical protein KatS3mg012_0420 [Gaiellaceae bacterium]
MRFDVSTELALFADSVRAAIGSWEPTREPDLGSWQDDRDDALAARLTAAGWSDLGSDPEMLGAVVAGAIELGRACAPICLVDEATLGGALWVGGRARHGLRASALVAPAPRGGLSLVRACGSVVPERTLDGSGSVRVDVATVEIVPQAEASARWSAWAAATLGYLAGVAERALALTVAHVRAREQFGAPLAALPAVQARLADAALAADGIALLAWSAATGGRGAASAERAWAGEAACEVTATAHQLHGAAGFALETGLHRWYRRARAVHGWSAAVSAALR